MFSHAAMRFSTPRAVQRAARTPNTLCLCPSCFDRPVAVFLSCFSSHVLHCPVARSCSTRAREQVFSQILRYAKKAGYFVPFLKGGRVTEGVAYEGATVLHANTGYYTEPIATLDFASLYPSIMMAHNLCYSTLVPASEVGRSVREEDIERAPGGAPRLLSSVLGSPRGLW